jgi:opacity protein-like surface antigen
MKKFITTLLVITGFAASAQAVIVGVDAGYFLDSEEEFLSARVGFEVAQSNAFSHQLDLELGYTDRKVGGAKGDIIPLMANYRFVAPVAESGWSYYVGAGLGAARVNVDGASINGPVRFREEAFAVQALAGVSYQLNATAAITLGARYLWIDDVKLAGSPAKLGDDVALSAGLSFKF